MCWRTVLATAFALVIPMSTAAQDRADGSLPDLVGVKTAAMTSVPVQSPDADTNHRVSSIFKVLAATYVGFTALDVVTTERALQSGRGREANPLMAAMAGHAYAFALTKAATATVTIVGTRRLARKHRVAAIAFWLAADVGLGMVVAHNARVGNP
jgi:hypothetical protein